ncbi:MAG: rRNA maturation RNase YbeY [Thermoflexaceae bacterium]|nr:rRNA maturation RNase YbeY [Thermoflexaceae bacterium]
MGAYDISIEVAVETNAIDIRELRALSEKVMSGENVAAGTALAVIITDDEEMRRMNREFLGIDEPTDVLSFPDEANDFVQGVADEPLLGDIAIALPTAERQARAAGHPLAAELAHLLVHGILHLCGYDHVDSVEDEANMRAREEHYLGDLGLAHSH